MCFIVNLLLSNSKSFYCYCIYYILFLVVPLSWQYNQAIILNLLIRFLLQTTATMWTLSPFVYLRSPCSFKTGHVYKYDLSKLKKCLRYVYFDKSKLLNLWSHLRSFLCYIFITLSCLITKTSCTANRLLFLSTSLQ